MDLTHQVNTIANINIFYMSNITCINFDIIYYLLPIIYLILIVDGVSVLICS